MFPRLGLPTPLQGKQQRADGSQEQDTTQRVHFKEFCLQGQPSRILACLVLVLVLVAAFIVSTDNIRCSKGQSDPNKDRRSDRDISVIIHKFKGQPRKLSQIPCTQTKVDENSHPKTPPPRAILRKNTPQDRSHSHGNNKNTNNNPHIQRPLLQRNNLADNTQRPL